MKVYSQKADHACGAACVRTICEYFHKPVLSERTLLKTLRAKFKTGIEPEFIEIYLREIGLRAEYREEKNVAALRRRWAAGWSPIICWADWGGHYCIVDSIGTFDAKSEGTQIDGLWLADPAAIYEGRDGETWTSIDRFKSMWYTPGKKKRHEVIYVRGD
jgi:hypothetical protein